MSVMDFGVVGGVKARQGRSVTARRGSGADAVRQGSLGRLVEARSGSGVDKGASMSPTEAHSGSRIDRGASMLPMEARSGSGLGGDGSISLVWART